MEGASSKNSVVHKFVNDRILFSFTFCIQVVQGLVYNKEGSQESFIVKQCADCVSLET